MLRQLMRTILASILVLIPLALQAQERKAITTSTGGITEQAYRAEIEGVMSSFHDAVTTHDGERLSKLFLADASLWLNVLTDQAYDLTKSKSPATSKVRVSDYHSFAKFVSTTTKSLDPRHANVAIHTDGTIATVYFDFVFLIDNHEENRGSETWQLVRSVEGWKIASIVYSSNPTVHN